MTVPRPCPCSTHCLPVYAEAIQRLAAGGADWIQFDEPVLVLDRTPDQLAAVARAYAVLAGAKGPPSCWCRPPTATSARPIRRSPPCRSTAIGLDFVRGPQNLDLITQHGFPADKWLAAGVVDGRNVWTNDLAASLDLLGRIQEHVPADRLMVSTSCSLSTSPTTSGWKTSLPAEIDPGSPLPSRSWPRSSTLTRALNEGEDAVADELAANRAAVESAAASPLRRNPAVRGGWPTCRRTPTAAPLPYAERAERQRQRLHLPPLPTTTIGSFPQTGEIRAARQAADAGTISAAEYEAFLEGQIADVIARQEALGLDVLVHGEPERNDMVQYFGEQLDGFAFTHHGWVQSYGSRYVRPPIIFGDVARPQPMTVRWATFAQRLTERPVKGMLTGPVTILNWSFVRDDQPRAETCRQIALAIRDEVADLDAAGIAIIQIDEPALREGLPLRHADQADYLAGRSPASGWPPPGRGRRPRFTPTCATASSARSSTPSPRSTPMCSRSRTPAPTRSCWRSSAPRATTRGSVPASTTSTARASRTAGADGPARAILTVLPPDQVWVNPDCGLKTRKPEEVWPALEHMVAAAREVRDSIVQGG